MTRRFIHRVSVSVRGVRVQSRNLFENHTMDSYLETFAANQGLIHLIFDIFSNLNPEDLANCRAASKVFKDVIDTSKQWNINKLKWCMKRRFTISKYGDIEDIYEVNPGWKKTMEHFLQNETRERLLRFVACVWKQYQKGMSCQTSTPLEWLKTDLDLLVNTPYNINELSQSHGFSPFQRSCFKDGIETLQSLIEYSDQFKIDFEVRDKIWGATAFHMACKDGSFEVVELLLEHLLSIGCKPYEQLSNMGRDIFHCAAMNSNPKVLKLLLENFRDKFSDARDHHCGGGIIHLAMLRENTDTFNFILDKRHVFGIDISRRIYNGNSVLTLAIQYSRADILEHLYECLRKDESEIDFDLDGFNGDTGISSIFKYSSFEILKIVERLRPDLLKNYIATTKPLNLYKNYTRNRNTDPNLIRYIFEIPVNALKQNLVHQECMSGNAKRLSKFLKNKDITEEFFNAQDLDGNSPLHLACLHGRYEIVELLLFDSKKRRIEVAIQNNNGQTPLQLAKLYGQDKITRELGIWLNKTENAFQCMTAILLRIRICKNSKIHKNCVNSHYSLRNK